MSKRVIKIMKLFKLANEDIKSEGIIIDRDAFLKALKGQSLEPSVKVETITVDVSKKV